MGAKAVTRMRRWLAAAVLWGVVLASSRAEPEGRCPAGFSPGPGGRCVQDDCIEAGGIFDAEMRCTCGALKACTSPLTYTRRARARCKDTCPGERLVACVAEKQPCPGESALACARDSECPACSYCDGKQCARATAIVVTGPLPDRAAGGSWGSTRVAFWPEKAWAARYLVMQGCRIVFADLETTEDLAERLADERVKALSYHGPCTEATLRKDEPRAGKTDIFGNKSPAAKPSYLPTLGGVSAKDLQQATRAALEKRLLAGFRRLGRRAARKKAAEAAEAMTRGGWLHFLINGTCHGLDDTSLADALLRPRGVYWGRKGAARPGLPLMRYDRAESE